MTSCWCRAWLGHKVVNDITVDRIVVGASTLDIGVDTFIKPLKDVGKGLDFWNGINDTKKAA